MKKLSRFKEDTYNTKNDFDYLAKLEEYFNSSIGTSVEKLQNFPKYVPRQDITNFLAKYELFKKVLNIPGSIVECGVLFGGGLMTFAQLSAIFEHTNYLRKIIGFDTFSGFPNLSKFDKMAKSSQVKKGAFSIDSLSDIKKSISLYDSNRFLHHINKIEIIKGNAERTIPKYVQRNPHTIISLLYLDFVLYKPTKIALENFFPLMPKGSVIAFNLLNDEHWPSTSKALRDVLGVRTLKLKKFPFSPYTQYVVI